MHRKSVGFKTLTITCLALALISTISLNIIRTYSINNTRTNALGSSNYSSSSSTLSDPSAIRLSITNGTNSCSNTQLTNAGDVCINTPTNGNKVAIGSHTLTVEVGDHVDSLKVTLGAYNNGNNNYLVNQSNNSLVIPPTNGSLTNPQSLTASDHNIGSWGYAIPGEFGFDPISQYTNTATLEQAKFAKVPQGYLPDTILQVDDVNQPEYTKQLYYGIRLNDPTNTQAGVYSQVITYTATAILPPAPELNTITPNTFYLTSGHDGTVKIKGSNTPTPLSNITNIYLDLNGNGTMDNYEECRDLTTDAEDTTNSTLICTMPTDTYLQYLGETTILSNLTTTNNGNGTGTYPIRLIHTSGDTATNLTYSYRNPSGQIPTTSSTNLPTGTNGTTNRTMSICRNGDPSDCQVDIDDNMIPVKYVGTHKEPKWAVVTNSEQSTNKGLWYNYSVGETATQGGGAKWANAVTVQSDKLATYKQAKQGNNPNVVVDNNDILGYYTYIPRYAYEVQRPNAVDRVVSPQNFNIHFETATDPKKTPVESCNLAINTDPDNNPMWGEQGKPSSTNDSNAGPNSTNVLAKDYRTTCVNESGGAITRTYGSATGTTWATHPAFSWLDSDGNGEELNGLWIGKYETTGSAINPTILPNQKHIGDMNTSALGYVGGYYTIAKHIGVYDPNNTGGNDITANEPSEPSGPSTGDGDGWEDITGEITAKGTTLNATGQWTSLHNLSTATSHMLKNSEWGAIAYLATSDYGAGIGRVFNNAQASQSDTDDNNQPSDGVTGCGPYNSSGDTTTYTNGGTIGTNTACRSTNIEYSYNGTIGQLASTTNNPYGIYDLAGGAYEYVAGNLSSYANKATANPGYPVNNDIATPYVDIYLSTDFSSSSSPAWATSTSTSYYYYSDICAWGNCGGDALHETKLYQSVSSNNQSWGDDGSNFVYSGNRWFLRGGCAASLGSIAGLFYSSYGIGGTSNSFGFRSVLLSAP